MIEGVNQMELAATWTHKKPTIQDIVEVYMSRSGYFNRPHKFFPRVHLIPGMQKWLQNEDGAPDVWGDKRPSFQNLSDMLDLYESPGKKKKMVTKHKRKQKHEPSSHSEEEVVKGKGKGKAKAKKAGGGVARRRLALAILIRMMTSK